MDKTKDVEFYSTHRFRNRGPHLPVKAIVLFNRRLKLSPKNPGQIYDYLGMLFLRSNEYSKSAKKLKKAIIINPNKAETWENLAKAQLALGKNEEGLKCLKIAMSLTQSDLNHRSLIKTLYERGKVEEIQQIYEEIEKILPAGTNKGYFYYSACLISQEFGLISIALIFSRKSLKFYPHQGTFYLQYAKLLRKEGFFEEAIEAFRTAICVEPSYNHFYIDIAMLWYDLMKPQKAIDVLKSEIESSGLDDSVLFYIVLMRYHIFQDENEIEKEKDGLIKVLKSGNNKFYTALSEELKETQLKILNLTDEKTKEFTERKIKALKFILSWVENYHKK